MASRMLEEIQEKHKGSQEHEIMAMNVAATTYSGEFCHLRRPRCVLNSFCSWRRHCIMIFFPCYHLPHVVSCLFQTTSAAESFLLAMAMFPEVQRRAQAELDKVVGPHRLPRSSDVENLVYIRAVVMETLRWMPIAPFGVPHVATEDDTYRGYHIPKGTAVVPVSSW